MGFGILVVVHFLISTYTVSDLSEPGWFSFFCGLVIGFGYLFSCFEGIPGSQLGLSRSLSHLFFAPSASSSGPHTFFL
jgi:hypothetical protein